MVVRTERDQDKPHQGKLSTEERETILNQNFGALFGDSGAETKPVEPQDWLVEFKKAGEKSGLEIIE